jgi:hypothetical protein
MEESSGLLPRAGAVIDDANRATIVLPAQGFENVVRLVLAGYSSRLSLGFEALDDLQLAVELALRSLPLAGGRATVTLERPGGELTVTIGPFAAATLERRLEELTPEGIDLASLLRRLVDTVETSDATLVLRKRLGAPAA